MTSKSTQDILSGPSVPMNDMACLCGSGLLFGKCCRANISLLEKNLILSDSPQALLENARAKITRYSVWHLQQTLPLVVSGKDLGKKWMTMDIEAMSDLVGSLLFAYKATTQMDQFLPALERLRKNIGEERWQRKITYFQAFTLFIEETSTDKAQTEILKLAPFDNEQDPDVLQLYLDIFRHTLSFGERQNTIRQLLSVTKKAGDRLQYECLAAIDHFLINDKSSAKRLLNLALENFRSSSSFSSSSLYTRQRYASALELDGNLNENENSTNESIEVFRTLAIHPDLNDSAKAEIYKQLGELYRSRGRHESASECFTNSIELQPMAICQIFLASSLVSTEALNDARDVLQLIEPMELNHEEKIDYAYTWFELAYKSSQNFDVGKALYFLREADTAIPYFLQLRNEMIIDLLDLKAGIHRKIDSTIWQKLEGLTKYVNLKPGMFGLSVDLNKIISEQSKKIKK